MFKTRKMKLVAMMVSASLTMVTFAPTVSSEAAGKQTMYVVSASDGAVQTKFTYNANGLLTKAVFGTFSADQSKYQYKDGYLNKRIYTEKSTHLKAVTTYQYDEDDRLETTNTTTKSDYRNDESSCDYTYDSKNRLKDVGGTKYTYNKKGLPIKMNEGGYVYKFTYDENGNLTGFKTSGEGETRQNTYDQNGCLAQEEWSLSGTTTYTYKKVKVPTRYAETVKQQQWEILNPDAAPHILY